MDMKRKKMSDSAYDSYLKNLEFAQKISIKIFMKLIVINSEINGNPDFISFTKIFTTFKELDAGLKTLEEVVRQAEKSNLDYFYFSEE